LSFDCRLDVQGDDEMVFWGGHRVILDPAHDSLLQPIWRPRARPDWSSLPAS
jgi:hypothetical protein